ncbi:MAG: Flp family type IVb pilin [Vicinamibacterales bacterium]
MWDAVVGAAGSLHALLVRLATEEEGQDLAEYAFLTAFVGLSCVLAYSFIEDAIAAGYVRWDQAEQDLWEPPPPGAGS